MGLKALQGLEEEKLKAEYDALQEKIKYYNELLAWEEMLSGVLKEELLEIKKKYGDDRVTEITDVENEIDIEDLIEEKTSVYTVNHFGYVKRQPEDVYKVQNRGGKGVSAMKTREEDFAEQVIIASTHDLLLFFTSKGRVHKIKGYEIPESSRTSRGMNLVNLLQLSEGEKVTAMIPIKDFSDGLYLNMVTLRGISKRTALSAYKNIRKSGLNAVDLDEGDELIAVRLTDGSRTMLAATHNGMVIRYKEDDVRSM